MAGYGDRTGSIPESNNEITDLAVMDVQIPEVQGDLATIFTEAFDQFEEKMASSPEDMDSSGDSESSEMSESKSHVGENVSALEQEQVSPDEKKRLTGEQVSRVLKTLDSVVSTLAKKPFQLVDQAFDSIVNRLTKGKNKGSSSSSSSSEFSSDSFDDEITDSIDVQYPEAEVAGVGPDSIDSFGVDPFPDMGSITDTVSSLLTPQLGFDGDSVPDLLTGGGTESVSDTRTTVEEEFYETSTETNNQLMQLLVDPEDSPFGEFMAETLGDMEGGGTTVVGGSDIGKWAAITAAIIALMPILKSIADPIAEFVRGMTPLFLHFFETIGPHIEDFAVLLIDSWTQLMTTLFPYVEEFAVQGLILLNTIISKLIVIADFMGGALLEFLNAVKDPLINMSTVIITGLTSVLDVGFTGLSVVLETTLTGLSAALIGVFEAVEEMMGLVTDVFHFGSNVVGGAGDILGAGKNYVMGMFSKDEAKAAGSSAGNVVNNYNNTQTNMNYSDLSPYSDLGPVGVN